MSCDNLILVIFGIIAILFSVFYGVFGIEIFKSNQADKTDQNKKDEPTFTESRKWHKRWFNFLGSIIGWIALWMLLPKPVCNILNIFENGTLNISPSTVLLFFLFFIGVTGYLPITIVGVVNSIGEIFKKVTEKLIK